jgi:adenosylmethionine-8-amino-7-oxononanoate aminotransferase
MKELPATLLLAPPFVTTDDQIDRIVNAVGESVRAVLGL